MLGISPAEAAARLFGQIEQFLVYAADPAHIQVPARLTGVTMRKLQQADLEQWGAALHELKGQAERVKIVGFNDAYGAFVRDKLAHISWLVNYERNQVCRFRNIWLREHEAEIRHCYTLREFRGRGLYPFMIRWLCGEAASQGIRRVFMLVAEDNLSSKRGIEKAGLQRAGRVVRWWLPFLQQPLLVWKGYRLVQTRAGQVGTHL